MGYTFRYLTLEEVEEFLKEIAKNAPDSVKLEVYWGNLRFCKILFHVIECNKAWIFLDNWGHFYWWQEHCEWHTLGHNRKHSRYDMNNVTSVLSRSMHALPALIILVYCVRNIRGDEQRNTTFFCSTINR